MPRTSMSGDMGTLMLLRPTLTCQMPWTTWKRSWTRRAKRSALPCRARHRRQTPIPSGSRNRPRMPKSLMSPQMGRLRRPMNRSRSAKRGFLRNLQRRWTTSLPLQPGSFEPGSQSSKRQRQGRTRNRRAANHGCRGRSSCMVTGPGSPASPAERYHLRSSTL